MLSGQWQNLELPSTTATQPREYIDQQKARITQGLLSLLDRLEREAPAQAVPPTMQEVPVASTPATAPAPPPPTPTPLSSPTPPPPPPASRWKEIAITVAAVVAFLAGIAELSGYSLRDLFTASTPTVVVPAPDLPDTTKNAVPIDTPVTPPPPLAPTPKPVPAEPRTAPEKPATKLTLDLKTNKGTNNLTFTTGEDLEISYQVSQPCTLRVLYKLADDEVVLIQDNLAVSAASTGQWISLGTFEVSAPFGAESLHVFASSGPFPPLTTTYSDGYALVTEGLPNGLRKTRGIKRKFVEQKLLMTTQE